MFELVIEAIGWTIRVLINEIFVVLLEKVFYWPGWLVLRIITLGRYPPQGTVEHNRSAVGCFAIVFVASMPLLSALIG